MKLEAWLLAPPCPVSLCLAHPDAIRLATTRHRKLSRSSKISSRISSNRLCSPSSLCSASLSEEGVPHVFKRMPRRKNSQQQQQQVVEVGSSIRKAFSSMVFMLKSVHKYTLQLLLSDGHGDSSCSSSLQEIWCFVQREMHSSFLWLFQQVFAATPKLMLSLILLLANFTAFSLDDANYLAHESPAMFSATDTTQPAEHRLLRGAARGPRGVAGSAGGGAVDVGNGGSGNKRRVLVAGGTSGDGSSSSSANGTQSMYSQEDVEASADMNVMESSAPEFSSEDVVLFKFLLREAAVDVEYKYMSLDEEVKQGLVAPVSTRLEPDDYGCYDRTELLYQDALSADSYNPLLLVNYARFLHLVRHDHDRAEVLFRRAAEVDPLDGEVMSRFASFLWLARNDRFRAEDAFKNAIATDPSNPFYVGSYAHFLWNSAAEESECILAKQQQVNS